MPMRRSPQVAARARWFDRAAIRQLDRLASEEFGIPSIVLMENAGREVAAAVARLARADQPRNVLVLCGRGNNGGDGLVAARHLHNGGFEVTAGLASPINDMADGARVNAEIVRAMGIRSFTIDPESPLRLLRAIRGPLTIVDALLGTGLDRPVGATLAAIIGWVNVRSERGRARVVAVDVPSGLDCDTGGPLGCAVRASCTVTLVGPKVGFKNPACRAYLGRVRVGDIGVPIELVERLGTRPDRWARSLGPIVRFGSCGSVGESVPSTLTGPARSQRR